MGVEWSVAASVGVFLVAELSLVVSVATRARVERREDRDDMRQFLADSMTAANELRAQIKIFVQTPTDETFEKSILPIAKTVLSIQPYSRRWARKPFYASFEKLTSSLADMGSGFVGTPQELVAVTKRTLDASNDYVSVAWNTLCGL